MNATSALILAGIATALLPGLASAQDSNSRECLGDHCGDSGVARSDKAICVRRSEWTPARITGSCDPFVGSGQTPASSTRSEVPLHHSHSATVTSMTTPRDSNTPNKEPAQ